MSNPDPRAQRLIASQLQRVLIVDPSPSSARLLGDLLKQLGARYLHVEAGARGALDACQAIQPQMVFTELHIADQDGLTFVRALRRSGLNCRTIPVTVVTADATAATITASRDAGVHEFLRKPFTMKDLMRRVEAVTLKTRPWVEAVQYIGPDRRRFNSGDFQGMRKRKSDNRPPSHSDRIGQALKILRSAIDAVESDPTQALRSMMAQAAELQNVAVALNDIRLAEAVAGLHGILRSSAINGRLNRADLEAAATALWAFKPPEPPESPAKAA